MPDSVPRTFTLLLAHDGNETRIAAQTPFTNGRSPQMDLVLPYPYISRQHAEIQLDPTGQNLLLVCLARECFVNGGRVARHTLAPGDEIRLGFPDGPLLRVSEAVAARSSLRMALQHIKEPSAADADLVKLSWFIEAARRLNNVGAVQEILAALIDTTLELTRVERGYVFLRDPAGQLQLAAGRSLSGEALEDVSTISHSALQRAIESGSEFIVTDTLSDEETEPSESVVAQSIRAVICIPLRKRSSENSTKDPQVIGVLYLDSRLQESQLTRLDNDLLRTIATEAALLVENAALAQAEAAALRYREELLIASEIQQGLMSVRTPNPSFAQVEAHNVPCTGIGGDFYDVLCHNGALYVVVADISGKGVSAAVLGSTLQGLIHGQILSGLPLSEIALFANQYICKKNIRKYATLILLRLTSDGTVEYANCGHVQPLIYTHSGGSPGTVSPATNCNLPVGLLAEATYTSETLYLTPAQRIFVITDGVTEAEDSAGNCFGEGRLQSLVAGGSTLRQIFAEIAAFTAGAALQDDCTIVEVRYRPHTTSLASDAPGS